ncbi:hypothetical protein niasHS_004496 [Heterodera schachtii]|uniref:BTB domain-containing protein n=1 Tax=Heterodera schachtii TaxID=97005 RepID=A0ABD2JMI6_HETSC
MSDNLADRLKHLLGTAKLADAHFLVGDGDGKELLSAHKNILECASDVFEAMFRFDSKNGKSENASAHNPVEVPDVEVVAFKVMLSFIYADDLNKLEERMQWKCFTRVKILDYGPKSYKLEINFQIRRLSFKTGVFLALVQARLFDLEDFAHQCLRYICQNAGQLFESEEFLQIGQNLLCELFDRDQLVVSNEFEIWKAALRWADEKCRQNAIECSAENRRAALGPALFKIRFPLIPIDDFSKSIVPSDVLTIDEMFGIYQFRCHPNLRDLPGLKPLKFPWHGRIFDWNTAKGDRGTLAMEIVKFSAFSREIYGSQRNSKAVQINGFDWKILAEIKTKGPNTEKWLGFYLWCTASKDYANWSCKCSATLRIVSQKNGTEDLTKKYDRVFNNNSNTKGFHFITFPELMDPSKGFYDKDKDNVLLAIDFTVEEEKGTKKRKLADE